MIYADAAATTRLAPGVLKAMQPNIPCSNDYRVMVSIQENQKKVAPLLILIIKLIRSLMDTFNNTGLTRGIFTCKSCDTLNR